MICHTTASAQPDGQGQPAPKWRSKLKYLEESIIYKLGYWLDSANYKYDSVSLVRLLGVIQDISHDGKLIVKARFAPNVKDTVKDNVKADIGKVVKVFGPVRTPYVAIEPRKELKTLAVLGKEVYVQQQERDYGKGKRRD